jgi:hypothetical protein
MYRKYLVILMVVLLCNSAFGTVAFAGKRESKNKQEIVKDIKAKIEKLGTGEKAKVKVELINKTKIKGYVSKIEENSFTVTDSDTGIQTIIAYDQVKKVGGKNLSTGVKIAIAVAIAVPVTIFLTLFGLYYCNERAC